MSKRSLEQGLRDRLWVIDIPLQYRDEFTQTVLQWVRCSGIEWTIKRLKGLKVDLYRRRAGLPSLTWIRKNRKGDIAGCIGGLFRWADTSEKNFRKVVQTLMCYTVFTYSKATEGQLKKFSEALRAAPPVLNKQDLDTFSKAIKRTFGGQIVRRSSETSLALYRGSPTKRKPSRGLRSVAQDSDVLGDVDVFMTSDWGISIIDKYKTLFGPVLKGVDTYPILPPFGGGGGDMSQCLGGKIAFIQEPGGKLRSVASPFVLYQLALKHFGKATYDFISHKLPWDCTHDQSKPISVLKANLERGLQVHSVDLSSATDYFPLEFQSLCMRAVFGNIPDISLFETISRSLWISPIGAVRWNRGQPLGLYPSFAVFTASHGLLLWCLNGCQWNKDFFVLGDDVVILNDDLHRRYIKTLEDWGCPHSPDKSISSNQICEFAGKIITRKSVTSQFKWREISNNNFVDITRQLGQRSRILLSRKQRKVFDIIKHCSSPLGLGFSYEGSSLSELESNSQRVFGAGKEKILDSLVDQAGIIYKNHYGSKEDTTRLLKNKTQINLSVALDLVATFDKKVRLVLSELLPWFNSDIDPRLYSGVPAALGNTDLPPANLQPSRLTTLDRYWLALNLPDQ
jgi:hypothetical protein